MENRQYRLVMASPSSTYVGTLRSDRLGYDRGNDERGPKSEGGDDTCGEELLKQGTNK